MSASNMTLLDKISRMIAHHGPMTLAEYMHVCMADPEFGYYKSREAIGRRGDFITAPEVSQMFGELIGVWCIAIWQQLGKPSPFFLAELGPGKGTLMQDLLRAAKSNPGFMDAVSIVLIETSEQMQESQRAAIPQELVSSGKVKWEMDIAQLPDLPTIFVANEFFDVVPIRQYVKKNTGWHEIGISLSPDGELQKIALAGVLDPSVLPDTAENEPEGSVFEISPARTAIMQTITEHIKANSGAALIFDYGHLVSGYGDTFQAMADHTFADPLKNPGHNDLTSHVDFEALVKTANEAGLHNTQTSTQGAFLLQLGLLERAGSLGSNKSEQGQNKIRSEVERLAAPEQMGNLFKVLAICSNPDPIPGLQKQDA